MSNFYLTPQKSKVNRSIQDQADIHSHNPLYIGKEPHEGEKSRYRKSSLVPHPTQRKHQSILSAAKDAPCMNPGCNNSGVQEGSGGVSLLRIQKIPIWWWYG